MKHLCLITGEDILKKVKQKKQRRRDGKFNCLPFKFARAKKRFPGFERGKYYLFSANQKVGKSKLVDDLFLHYPDELRKSGKDIHTKVLYFSFEESEEDKAFQMSCRRIECIYPDLHCFQKSQLFRDRIPLSAARMSMHKNTLEKNDA